MSKEPAKNTKKRADDRRGGSPHGKGNEAHERNESLAKKIESMAAYARMTDLCLILDISETVVRKYYNDEWQRGKALKGAQLNQMLFRRAMGVPKPDDPAKPEEGTADPINPKNGFEREPDLGSAIWLRKSQYGDKETTKHDLGDADINITFNEKGDKDL